MSKDRLDGNQIDSIIAVRKAMRQASKTQLENHEVLSLAAGRKDKKMTDEQIEKHLDRLSSADKNYFNLTSEELGIYQDIIANEFIKEVEKVRRTKLSAEEGRVNVAQTLQHMMIWAASSSGKQGGELFDWYLVEAVAKARPLEVARNPLLLHRAMCILVDPAQRNQNFIAAYRATKAIYQAIVDNKEEIQKEWKEQERELQDRIDYLSTVNASESDDDALDRHQYYRSLEEQKTDLEALLVPPAPAMPQAQKEEQAKYKKALAEVNAAMKQIEADLQAQRKYLNKERGAKDKVAQLRGNLALLKKEHGEYKELLGDLRKYEKFCRDELKPGANLDKSFHNKKKQEALEIVSPTRETFFLKMPRVFGYTTIGCAVGWLAMLFLNPTIAPGFILAAGGCAVLTIFTTIFVKLSPMVEGVGQTGKSGVKKIGGLLEKAGNSLGEALEKLDKKEVEGPATDPSLSADTRGHSAPAPLPPSQGVGSAPLSTGIGANLGSTGIGTGLTGITTTATNMGTHTIAAQTLPGLAGVGTPTPTTHGTPPASGAVKVDAGTAVGTGVPTTDSTKGAGGKNTGTPGNL
ncbi:MAG: hypothetical protein JSS50_03015 [Proteobacteria bacterium]|nr:hypothetical protein [Pseudomonadota bacterium]